MHFSKRSSQILPSSGFKFTKNIDFCKTAIKCLNSNCHDRQILVEVADFLLNPRRSRSKISILAQNRTKKSRRSKSQPPKRDGKSNNKSKPTFAFPEDEEINDVVYDLHCLKIQLNGINRLKYYRKQKIKHVFEFNGYFHMIMNHIQLVFGIHKNYIIHILDQKKYCL